MAAEGRLLGFYKEVPEDASLRDESSKSKLLLDNFEAEIAMREDLFALVDSVAMKKPVLDEESNRLLQREHRMFRDNGLGLSKASRERFKDIKIQINKATSEFRRNMVEGREFVEVTADDMSGVPAFVLKSTSPEGKSDQEEGKFRLTFQPTQFNPTMRYAQPSETRKRYMIGYENRCANNVPLLRDIILLRDEAARMLGYVNHAAWRTEGLMSKTPANAFSFLETSRSQLQTNLQADLQTSKQLKSEHLRDQGAEYDGKFYVWDLSFFHRLMLEIRYAVDQKRIAKYFPIQTVVRAMLNIFKHIFGLDFQETSDDTATLKALNQTWHEDVQIWDVWDSGDIGGNFLGYLYLDLYTREGKYGSAANLNLTPISGVPKTGRFTSLSKYSPDLQFQKATPHVPSLLQHSDVVLLFHELGHGIHDLVSKTKYSCFHGTATIDDFCETPSQMLERWCWTESVLRDMSCHYSTLTPEHHKHWKDHGCAADPDPPREIPAQLVTDLVRTKGVNEALTTMRALWRSIFDMKVHSPPDRETLERMNITHEFNGLQRQIVGLDEPEDEEWGHGHAHFSHLIGGYDASYYGYLYSSVYASNIFSTAFSKDPLSPEVGTKYRRSILEKGGSLDEMSLLIDFLGRPPDARAFHEELGIIG